MYIHNTACSRLLQPSESGLETLFALDGVSGELRVVGGLDREKMETARLSVVVEDLNARGGRQADAAAVSVVVADVNDNRPAFDRSAYLASVVENAAEGTRVAAVRAADADKNKTVFYSLEGDGGLRGGGGSRQDLIVDADTGEVFVAPGADIDYEQVQISGKVLSGNSATI